MYYKSIEVLFPGFMDNVFHEGDKLVIIHSYEWLSPAIPGQSNLFLDGGVVF